MDLNTTDGAVVREANCDGDIDEIVFVGVDFEADG